MIRSYHLLTVQCNNFI